MNTHLFTFALVAALYGAGVVAEEMPVAIESPEAPSENDFVALRKTSPFTRVLSLPATYALRGVASINNEQVATLYNRETKKTIVVTPDGENEVGISLVEVLPASDLEGVAAKISFAGDEAELKYELTQIFPQPRPPGSGSGGDAKEGERRGPSPQDIERFKALPEEKQGKLREYIGHVMRNYPDMSREEKGNLIRGAMIRLTDGRDIEVPQAPAQPPESGSNSGADQRNRSDERGENRERR
ncbi:MAG: hypothetical protein NWT04_07065 [Verrucomicrobiales bacterium]|jgi:hypothetical protein|nr:hypothetical protein [Verrucomicrobiales bacterium]